jgi:hypothetical protein
MAGALFCQDIAELEVNHSLAFEFPTPHIAWGRPYGRCSIRILFFMDGRGTNPRECVELMQRFDIEGKADFRTCQQLCAGFGVLNLGILLFCPHQGIGY